MSGRRFHTTLYGQVLVATAIGVLVGHFWPAAGVAMKPLGDGFIKLVRMIVAPIIFCTVIVGIAGAGDMKTVGKAGVVALLYFEVVSTLALVIGLLMVNLVQPGAGMNVDVARLDTAAVAQYTTAGRSQTTAGFLLDVIPATAVDAFAKGDILQVLLISMLFGFALRSRGATGRPLVDLLDTLSGVLFGIVGIIMKAAPLGALGAMAFTVANFGVGTLAQLGKLIACFYATCLLFVFVVLSAIAWAHGFGIWRFIKYIITSKGAAGVAGAALIVLAATLSATGGIPVAGVALILGIHRFMGEAMAVTNLIGNGVATIVVGKWCGQLDEARLTERLENGVREIGSDSGGHVRAIV